MDQDDHPAEPTDPELTDPEPRLGIRSPSEATPLDGRSAGGVDLARDALDRVRDLVEHPVVRVGIAAAVLVIIGWWFLAGDRPGELASGSEPFTAGGTTIAFATPTTPAPDANDGDGATDPDGDVVVHAAGAVASPGVYRLPAGSRVDDLIVAAGGLTVDADANRLNLADVLSDGARVYVRRVGETEVPTVEGVDGPTGPDGGSGGGSGGGSAGGSSDGSAGGKTAALIDINRATLDQLEELPGVGPATAQAIVSHRDQNGSFRSVDELLEVRGIGPAKLEQIRPLVVV